MFLTIIARTIPVRFSSISRQYLVMPTRTSTRQAAVKANQAFSHGIGTKRKVSTQAQSPKKKGKQDVQSQEEKHYEKPSVADEAQETKATESRRKSQILINEHATDGTTQKTEAQVWEEGVKEEQEPEAKPESLTNATNGKLHISLSHNEFKLLIFNQSTGAETAGKTESTKAGSAIKVSPERENALPSSILEKGIIYFFFRPRVNVDEPHSLADVARSFFVLRPSPKGAEIEHGLLGDETANCRLLMLPKKKFPTSGRERDMAFVEKAQVTLKTIRDSLMTEGTYETKTQGGRITPASRPYAEGVYALIKDGKNTHLAYILTIPQEFKDVQSDFGLHARGSFIVQSKNPEYPGPATARLPQKPEYPEKYVFLLLPRYVCIIQKMLTRVAANSCRVLEKFKDYRWIPTEPELIDYSNAQILMIGQTHEHLGKAGEAHMNDKDMKVSPGEELDRLEAENEERARSLSGKHQLFFSFFFSFLWVLSIEHILKFMLKAIMPFLTTWESTRRNTRV